MNFQKESVMKTIRLTLIVAAVIGVIISANPALSQNKVQPIDTEGIKQMMIGQDCPLFLVATAAWCGPCREELPVLNKLYTKYKEKGLKLAAISLDADGPEPMQRLVDKLDLKFPVYWAGEKMAYAFNIFGVPTILVVQDGKVKERIIGKRDENFLESKISTLMSDCTP